jgi:hypothetical protein
MTTVLVLAINHFGHGPFGAGLRGNLFLVIQISHMTCDLYQKTIIQCRGHRFDDGRKVDGQFENVVEDRRVL